MAFAQILIEVDIGPGVDDEELERHSSWLREELLQLDVESVERVAAVAPPPGAKGSGGSTVGMLLLTASNSAVAVALTGVLRSWIDRTKGRKITLRLGGDSLEVSRVSREDQSRLIAAWLDMHAER